MDGVCCVQDYEEDSPKLNESIEFTKSLADDLKFVIFLLFEESYQSAEKAQHKQINE